MKDNMKNVSLVYVSVEGTATKTVKKFAICVNEFPLFLVSNT